MNKKTANRLAFCWAMVVVLVALIAYLLGYEPIGGWQLLDVFFIALFAIAFPIIFLGIFDINITISKWETGHPATQVYARELAGITWEVLHIGVLNLRGDGYIDVALGKELRNKLASQRPLFVRLWRIIKNYPYYGKRGQALSGVMLELKESWADRTQQIPFRPGHPSIETLLTLAPGNIIKLHYQVKPMKCALPYELCAYLRVEKATPTEQSVN